MNKEQTKNTEAKSPAQSLSEAHSELAQLEAELLVLPAQTAAALSAADGTVLATLRLRKHELPFQIWGAQVAAARAQIAVYEAELPVLRAAENELRGPLEIASEQLKAAETAFRAARNRLLNAGDEIKRNGEQTVNLKNRIRSLMQEMAQDDQPAGRAWQASTPQ